MLVYYLLCIRPSCCSSTSGRMTAAAEWIMNQYELQRFFNLTQEAVGGYIKKVKNPFIWRCSYFFTLLLPDSLDWFQVPQSRGWCIAPSIDWRRARLRPAVQRTAAETGSLLYSGTLTEPRRWTEMQKDEFSVNDWQLSLKEATELLGPKCFRKDEKNAAKLKRLHWGEINKGWEDGMKEAERSGETERETDIQKVSIHPFLPPTLHPKSKSPWERRVASHSWHLPPAFCCCDYFLLQVW